MDIKGILSTCDHTLLSQTATFEDIKALCDDAIKYRTASVCIPPCYVKPAKFYVGDRMRICTVVGFPNGNCTTATKVFETEEAVANGADEIDMVINIGMLKAKEYFHVLDEIRAVKRACDGRILKVIIETCLLTEEEKIKMCELVTKAGAKFIKTSTGFSTGGATFDDVKLLAKHIGPEVKIKAAGGIKTVDDAKKFILLGATRLGTSRLVKIAKGEENDSSDEAENKASEDENASVSETRNKIVSSADIVNKASEAGDDESSEAENKASENDDVLYFKADKEKSETDDKSAETAENVAADEKDDNHSDDTATETDDAYSDHADETDDSDDGSSWESVSVLDFGTDENDEVTAFDSLTE